MRRPRPSARYVSLHSDQRARFIDARRDFPDSFESGPRREAADARCVVKPIGKISGRDLPHILEDPKRHGPRARETGSYQIGHCEILPMFRQHKLDRME